MEAESTCIKYYCLVPASQAVLLISELKVYVITDSETKAQLRPK